MLHEKAYDYQMKNQKYMSDISISVETAPKETSTEVRVSVRRCHSILHEDLKIYWVCQLIVLKMLSPDWLETQLAEDLWSFFLIIDQDKQFSEQYYQRRQNTGVFMNRKQNTSYWKENQNLLRDLNFVWTQAKEKLDWNF